MLAEKVENIEYKDTDGRRFDYIKNLGGSFCPDASSYDQMDIEAGVEAVRSSPSPCYFGLTARLY